MIEEAEPPRSRLRLVLFLFAAAAVVVAVAPVVFYVVESRRMEAGERPLADSTQATLDGVSLRLDRYAIHPILSQYKRVLTIHTSDRPEVVFEMEPDTGAMARLVACAVADKGILLSDGASDTLIAADGATRKLDAAVPEAKPACLRTIGVFDAGNAAKGRYGYLPAQP